MLTFNEDEFYSLDYENKRKKNRLYDPLDVDTENPFGEYKKLDESSRTGFSSGSGWASKPMRSQSEPPISATEAQLVPMATPTPERKEEYGWWRKETDYTDWLNSQNLDPNKMDDFTGNKMFKDYIAWKAQNPEGLALLGKGVAEGLGSVIQSVSDTVASVPGLKKAVKPVGSILQFIGNLFDAPRNVLAGAWAAISSGHWDETAENMWDALKFSISASIGNESEDNKYFSWMDGQLRNLTDKARQGMSDKEYAKYIDSDDFRQTKRLWQVGGMVLDMVLDPAWLIGAGEVKALRAMKEINLGKQALNNLVKNISGIKHVAPTLEAISPFLKTEKAYVKIADRVNGFLKKSDKLIKTVGENNSFMKAMGIDADLLKAGKLSNLDTMEILLNKYKALGKGDMKGFEYAFRARIPFVSRALGGTKIGPSMQPLIDVVKNKIGGYERGMLHVAGRIEERVKGRVGIHEVNELRYKAEKYLDRSLKEVAGGKDPMLAELANDVLTPDKYPDFLADLITFDPDGVVSASLKVPRDGKLVMESMYGAHLPLLRAVLNDVGLKEVHTALKGMHSKTLLRTSQEIAAEEKALMAFGVDAGTARKIREANPDDISGIISAATEMPKGDMVTLKHFSSEENINKINKLGGIPNKTDVNGLVWFTEGDSYIRGKNISIDFPKNKILDLNIEKNLDDYLVSGFGKTGRSKQKEGQYAKLLGYYGIKRGNDVAILGEFVDKSRPLIKQLSPMRTEVRAGQNFYKRTLDPRLKAYLGIGEEAERDVMKLGPGALASDPARVIHVPSDVGNTHLQEIVFSKPADLTGFRELLRTDKEKAFMKMNTAIRELRRSDPEKFFELTQLSDQVIDGKLMKMKDLPFEQWSGNNPQYLIQQGSISGMNELGRKGFIIEGYSGDIYKGGTMPLLEKIMNDERMIERIHSVSGIFEEGLYSDFIRKARTPQEIADLGAGWVPIKTGIFRGFAVQDFLEKPLQNAMKGVFGVVEAEMPHNWWVGHTLKGIAAFNNWWKVNIYLKNPAAQARNFLTNRLMMMGDNISFMNIFSQEARDGRKVSRYMEAIKDYQRAIVEKNEGLMAKFKTRFTEIGKETAILDGRKIAVNELAEEMMRLNVSSHGLIGDIADQAQKSLPNAAGEAAKEGNFITRVLGHKYNLLGKNDISAIKMGDVAQAVEQGLGRNEYFLTLVNQKGWSIEKAAARVNEIMIDYGRISRTEGALRKYAIPFYCVPDYTEILTRNGWKFYTEVKIGDEVLTYNIHLDCNEWQKIDDLAVFDFDGELLSIGHSHYNFQFTKDHRIPVVKDRSNFRRIVRAYELKSGDRIPLVAPGFDENFKSILTEKESALLAWIVTDGYFRWRRDSFESMIYQSPKKHADKIRKMFGNWISSENVHPDTGVICFRIKTQYTKNITKYFKGKFDLPGIVTRLNRKCLEIMFEAMMDAEGCRNNSNPRHSREMGDSFSQKLGSVIDSFQIICNLLGKSFQISYDKKYDRAVGYVKKTRFLFYRPKFDKMVEYSGKIWCPKTLNSTWYMRQNGRVMISGNTWQSRMIPIMLQKAIEQPAYFTKFTQFKNNMYNMLELDKNFAPFGETTSEGVPWVASADWGKFLSGKPLSEIQTQYLSGEGWMPQAVLNLFKFDGLSRLLRPIAKDMNFFEGALENVIGATTSLLGNVAKGGLEYVVSGLTPAVKLPVESFANYSFQFQRPLETYPDQTIRYIGMNLKPIQVNMLKSLWGGFREINDLASVFDKRTSSGEAKYTWTDYLLKHIGAKPYERNEVREVNSALWKMRELYQSNLSDAKHAQNNPKAQESHAMKALMAYHAIDTLEWYKTFILEMRDKRSFILGIQQDISDIETKMRDNDISRKRRAALGTQRYDLLQKLNQLNGDIERL